MVDADIHFSVVIPTYGREALVRRLLESLSAARSTYAGQVEILVVDSSTALAAQHIQESCEMFQALYFPGQQSVRWKRNFGVSHAKFDIILFIDSDCEVDKSIFHEHSRVYAEHDGDPHLGGVFGVTRFVGNRTFIWKVIERTSFIDVFSFAERYPYVEWAIGNNISYFKCVFERVGCFDESFPFRLGGDDLELGLRIARAGYLIKTNAKAVTYHSRDTWNSWRALLERATRWGRMEYYVCKKHPYLLRRDLPRQEPIFLLLFILAIPFALLFSSPTPILLVLLWSALTYLVRVSLDWLSGERKNVFFDVLAQVPATVYQVSCIGEYVKHGRLDILYKRMIFSNNHMQSDWPRETRRLWAALLSLMLIIFVAALFARQ